VVSLFQERRWAGAGAGAGAGSDDTVGRAVDFGSRCLCH
jgi:hypothetical protein